jgi:hypothetical protein
VQISPRWPAADILEAEVQVCYENARVCIGYHINYLEDCIQIDINCSSSEILFHILLPVDATVISVKINGENVDFSISTIEKSNYVDFVGKVEDGAEIKIGL